jgi:hypothetical protein
VLTAFGVGFAPPIQCQARPDLRLRAHAIDVVLPLAIAPVASLYRMRSGGQPRVVKKWQGLFQGRGKELVEGVAQQGAPQEPTPQFGQCVEGRLGPTASIEQGVPLVHARTQRADLGQPPGEAPQGLACGLAPVTLDDPISRGKQRGTLLCQPLVRAGRLLGGWRARAPLASWGVLGCQALAGAGHGP